MNNNIEIEDVMYAMLKAFEIGFESGRNAKPEDDAELKAHEFVNNIYNDSIKDLEKLKLYRKNKYTIKGSNTHEN